MGRCSSKSARRSWRDGCNRLRGLSVCFTAFSRASGDETPVSGGGLPRHEGCSTPLSDEAASFTLLRPLIRSGSAKRGRERRERPLAFAGAVTGSNVIWSGYSICILYTLNSLGPHSLAVANLPPATVAHVMQVGLPLLSILYCPPTARFFIHDHPRQWRRSTHRGVGPLQSRPLTKVSSSTAVTILLCYSSVRDSTHFD